MAVEGWQRPGQPHRAVSTKAPCLAGSVSLLQCAAESIPLPDESQDVVYSVYMFHEMPLSAQRAALQVPPLLPLPISVVSVHLYSNMHPCVRPAASCCASA